MKTVIGFRMEVRDRNLEDILVQKWSMFAWGGPRFEAGAPRLEAGAPRFASGGGAGGRGGEPGDGKSLENTETDLGTRLPGRGQRI